MNRIVASLVVLSSISLSWSAAAHAEIPYDVQWSRQFGTTGEDYGKGLAVDLAGNVYIGGDTAGSLGGPNAGLFDAFLTKYDSAGNSVWSRQIGSTGNDITLGITVDAVGNAYITGYTHGSLGGPNAGSDDAFLIKYDGIGNLIWSRQIGTIKEDAGFSVAVDDVGNVYISGLTAGSLGGPNAGLDDVFIAKYDGLGNYLWSRQVGTTTWDAASGVGVDAAGNAYIGGSSAGSLGGPNAGSYDAFLIKYDGAGNLIWSRQTGSTSSDEVHSLAVDASGNAYLSGRTSGSLGGPNAGNYDAFLIKYDGAGNLIWSRQIGTTAYDDSFGVAADGAGEPYISGYTLGNLAGPNAGSDDAFLTKYDGAGNLLWSRQIGSAREDDSSGVAVNAAGEAYISGYTHGDFAGPNAGRWDAFVVKFAVPEPCTFSMVTFGILGLPIWRYRRCRDVRSKAVGAT